MAVNNAALQNKVDEANERAARAESELEALRDRLDRMENQTAPQAELPASERTSRSNSAPGAGPSPDREEGTGGDEALRREPMMAHLMDSLGAGKDIGHYGRLVFAMIARHFMSDEEVVAWLQKDSDFDGAAARALLRQVEGRDYNPPKRERILQWQREQEFPILPDPDDPDCGNVYRNLKFPDRIYEHIQEYLEDKAEAAEGAGINERR